MDNTERQSRCDAGDMNARLLAAQPDLTSTGIWKETREWFMRLHGPSFGKVSNAEHLDVSPDGSKIAFTGSTWTSFEEGSPRKNVCLVDVSEKDDGHVQSVSQSQNSNKLPKWSPDGKTLAFLSDRICKGHFLPYSMTLGSMQEARLLTSQEFNGVVQDLEWSIDGASLLIHVAPFGLPISGAEGSGYLADGGQNDSGWMPTVKSAAPPSKLCSLWLCDMSTGGCRRISSARKNVWSFCWAGPQKVIVKVSDSSIGYSHQAADLIEIDLLNGQETLVRAHNDQMVGNFVSTDSGSRIALVESAGSERVKIVGKVAVIDTSSGKKTVMPTEGVDVGCLEWIAQDRLFAMGLTNMHSVALEINTSTLKSQELWSTTDQCGGANGFAQGTLVPGEGFVVLRSNWKMPPKIGLVDQESRYRVIRSFDHDGTNWLRSQCGEHKTISWKSADGLEIYGILYLPSTGKAPYRTILSVHGGPFSAVTDKWLGYNQVIPWLVAHGYAVLSPNPRGSVGRGADFTNAVKGDIGGGDAQDLLSGLDHLVELGVADSKRLGVIGGSYGGYMTSWLVTQTNRFSAAVAMSPVSDYKLQWICGDERMPILGEEIYVKDSLAERRSPLANVQYCKTPTLLTAGTQDHCTPPQHAHYFSTALLDQGVPSVVAEYPRAGHGVRTFPEVWDAYIRILSWFDAFV